MENKQPQFIEGYWRNGQPKPKTIVKLVEEKEVIEKDYNAEVGALLVAIALVMTALVYWQVTLMVLALSGSVVGSFKFYKYKRERREYLEANGLIVNNMGKRKVI